jgi:uncharacterized protein
LIKAIVEVVAAGGNVLIPAFALGRAQEIILAIRTSALFHSVNVPVYVDGLVREVTDLFQNQLDLLPAAVKNFAKTQSPFFSEKSSPRIISLAEPLLVENRIAQRTPPGDRPSLSSNRQFRHVDRRSQHRLR